MKFANTMMVSILTPPGQSGQRWLWIQKQRLRPGPENHSREPKSVGDGAHTSWLASEYVRSSRWQTRCFDSDRPRQLAPSGIILSKASSPALLVSASSKSDWQRFLLPARTGPFERHKCQKPTVRLQTNISGNNRTVNLSANTFNQLVAHFLVRSDHNVAGRCRLLLQVLGAISARTHMAIESADTDSHFCTQAQAFGPFFAEVANTSIAGVSLLVEAISVTG